MAETQAGMQAGHRNTRELGGSSEDTRQASWLHFPLPLTPGAPPSRPVPTLQRTLVAWHPPATSALPRGSGGVTGPGHPAALSNGRHKWGLRHAWRGEVPGLGKVPGKTRRWSELAAVGRGENAPHRAG